MSRLAIPAVLSLAAAAALAVSLASAPAGVGAADPGVTASALPPPGVVDGRTGRAIAEAGARIVDVRTPQEFAAGHVPGAINIPFDEIGKRAAEIGPPQTPVLLYCRTGRRSAIAASALRDLGYEKLWDMQSFDAWPGR